MHNIVTFYSHPDSNPKRETQKKTDGEYIIGRDHPSMPHTTNKMYITQRIHLESQPCE